MNSETMGHDDRHRSPVAARLSWVMRTDWWLASFLLLAASLRLWNIGGQSLWLDEAFSVRLGSLPFDEFWHAISNDTHPPFYFLLLRQWIALWGKSEVSVRLLSAVCGALAVVAFWGVGRRCHWSSWVRNSSMGAVCLSPLLIAHAQEARPHGLLLALGMTSLWLLLALRRRFTITGAVVLWGVNTAILYTQYMGGFLLAAEAIALVISRARGWKVDGHPCSWLAIFVGSGLAFLPWMPSLIGQFQVARDQLSWLREQSSWAVFEGLQNYTGPENSALGWFGFAVLVLLSCIGGYRRTGFARAVLLLWIVLPFVAALLSNLVDRPIPIARSNIAVVPVMFLLAAEGLNHAGRLRYVFAAVLLLLFVWGAADYHLRSQKRPWREAARMVHQESEGRELVLFCVYYGSLPFRYYEPLDSRPMAGVTYGPRYADVIREMHQAVGNRRRFWLILSYLSDDTWLRRSAAELGYEQLTETSYRQGLTVIHYERIREAR